MKSVASCETDESSSSAKIGIPRIRSALGCAMAATLPCRRFAVTSRGGVPGAELLDLELGTVEALDARAVELLSAPPERERLVQRHVAALEPRDELVQLALEVLERGLGVHGRTSS